MERIRVGLTGLGFVLLLVFVAAAGMRPSQSVSPDDAAGETLSLLGVVPHADDDQADMVPREASREQPAQDAPPAGPIEI